jgi:hypothetical protein
MFLAFAAVFFFFYYLLFPAIVKIKQMFLIGFDLSPYFKDFFKYSFDILSFNINMVMLVAFLFALTFLIFYLSHKSTNEPIAKSGLLVFASYFLVYYLALSFVVVIASIELLFKRRQRW